MTDVGTPRAFLSHSWQDNDQVRPLAEQLQASGVAVWFDEWEMQPGDSLVQKIDEGLSDCDFFLVAISAASVSSKWVREELSSAVVRRLEERTRVIAIRLDETPLPTVINHLYWVRLNPLDNAVTQLLKAMFNISDKPAIGPAPDFIHRGVVRRNSALSGLSPEASAVLRTLVQRVHADEHPFDTYVRTGDLDEQLLLDETELADALDELQERALIRPLREYGGDLVRLRPRAWTYLAPELDYDLQRALQAVAQAVVGHQEIDGPTLEQETGLPLEHLRIAVGILDELQLVEVYAGGIGAGRPYGFVSISATRKTREWVKVQKL
jgi:hypothetical protein